MPRARSARTLGVAAVGADTVDMFMDLYVSWRERAREVHVTFERWSQAGDAQERASAFDSFSDALNEEGYAAQRFDEFLIRAGAF